MELGTAFLLGLVGSLHCGGMCGPLALALPGANQRPLRYLLGRLAYNFGRISTYGLLGAAVGAIGGGLATAGLQQAVSLVAGTAVLAGVLLSRSPFGSRPISVAFPWIGRLMAGRMRNGSFPSLALLGLLNGWLPCGLVYVACAAAASTGGILNAIAYMLVFGSGTLPMMLAASLFGKRLQISLRLRFQRLIPAALTLVGLILVLRGLALGIPYLSPDLASPDSHCAQFFADTPAGSVNP
jgi:uncharacterized protein